MKNNAYAVALCEVIVMARRSADVLDAPGLFTSDQLVLRECMPRRKVEATPLRPYRLFLRSGRSDVWNTLRAVLKNGGSATYDEIARLPRSKYTIEGVMRAVMLGLDWRSS